MDNRELDLQIQRRVMRSDITPVPEYSSFLVDFKLLYDYLQQNWSYAQKMALRNEFESRLKTTLPTPTGVFPQWNDLMSLGVGGALPQAACEAALIVLGSETENVLS